MAETSLSLTPVASGGMLATLKPPQTVDNAIPVGKGAYCFVIDVSGRFVPSPLKTERRIPQAVGRPCAASPSALARAFMALPPRARCAA